MFERRNRGQLKNALQRAKDPELAQLYDALADRRERVATLELEWFEARSELATFEAEVESRLGALQDRVEALEDELRRARREAARRAQWGDRADTDGLRFDALGSYERTWRRTPPPPTSTAKPVDAGTKEQIKRLYRALAKRFHPDLTTDPEEKAHREKLMAQVNSAYSEGNLAKLQELMKQPDRPTPAEARTREHVMADLRAEIRRLDGVVHRLQGSLDRLTRSHEVQLMLEATMARRQGRDLIGEMASDLRKRAAELEGELARLS